jgi:hypothetical protein
LHKGELTNGSHKKLELTECVLKFVGL